MKPTDDPIVHLVRHAVGTDSRSLPAPVLTHAADLLLDTLGCILCGSSAEGIGELRQTLLFWGGAEQATVFGFGDRTSAPWAALLNSGMAHANDFDDTHDPAVNHGCVTLVPALLAVAEASCASTGESAGPFFRRPVTGREVLAALAVGLDVSNRLGLAFIHYLHTGWLPTTLWGPFACAAACGRLLGLDEEAMRHAFGLAYAQVHGNRQALADGTLTKRLQPAFSAVAGVQAAFLAAAGVTGPRNIVAGRFGIPELYTAGKVDLAHLTEGLGERFETANVSIKPYPCCRCTHAVIDAALRLQAQHAFDWRDIAAGAIRLPPNSMGQIGGEFRLRDNPTVDAQFSAQYTAALAFVKGCPRLDDFRQQSVVANADVRELAPRFGVAQFEPDNPGLAPIEMSVTLRSSQTFDIRVEAVKGSPANPLSEDELLAKFDDCVDHAVRPYSPSARERIADAAHRIAELEDVSALVAVLAPRPGA